MIRGGNAERLHGNLNVTIEGQKFEHLAYHFVLTYSNWETVTLCFSESFESLSAGLQNALWQLGGAPEEHRTDSLSAAVNNLKDPDEFTARYQGLLDHYGLRATHTQAGKANENGDVEQSHYRFKTAVDQELMLARKPGLREPGRIRTVSGGVDRPAQRRSQPAAG